MVVFIWLSYEGTNIKEERSFKSLSRVFFYSNFQAALLKTEEDRKMSSSQNPTPLVQTNTIADGARILHEMEKVFQLFRIYFIAFIFRSESSKLNPNVCRSSSRCPRNTSNLRRWWKCIRTRPWTIFWVGKIFKNFCIFFKNYLIYGIISDCPPSTIRVCRRAIKRGWRSCSSFCWDTSTWFLEHRLRMNQWRPWKLLGFTSTVCWRYLFDIYI